MHEHRYHRRAGLERHQGGDLVSIGKSAEKINIDAAGSDDGLINQETDRLFPMKRRQDLPQRRWVFTVEDDRPESFPLPVDQPIQPGIIQRAAHDMGRITQGGMDQVHQLPVPVVESQDDDSLPLPDRILQVGQPFHIHRPKHRLPVLIHRGQKLHQTFPQGPIGLVGDPDGVEIGYFERETKVGQRDSASPRNEAIGRLAQKRPQGRPPGSRQKTVDPI